MKKILDSLKEDLIEISDQITKRKLLLKTYDWKSSDVKHFYENKTYELERVEDYLKLSIDYLETFLEI